MTETLERCKAKQAKTRGWLHRLATENGWVVFRDRGLNGGVTYQRGVAMVTVSYSITGAIISACRHEPLRPSNTERPYKGKRTRVRQWLIEPA